MLTTLSPGVSISPSSTAITILDNDGQGTDYWVYTSGLTFAFHSIDVIVVIKEG